MLLLNETKFAKFSGSDSRVLENSFIYILSNTVNLEGDGQDILAGNDKVSLIPSESLIERLKNGEIGKKRFKKEYIKELKSDENLFTIYTIIRSLNEKSYMPIFVCSDEEWELGYLKIFAGFLSKNFGLKQTNAKKYKKEVQSLWKDAKKRNKGSKARRKAFNKSLRSHIKGMVQISFEGLERLEKLDKKYAIHRIVILLNHSEDAVDEVSKKAVINSIRRYSEYNKAAKKTIKRVVKQLDVKKRTDRWSKRDAINVAMGIYAHLYGDDEQGQG